VTFAGEREDSAVMNESIDDGSSGHLVGKDLCPLFERQVRCEPKVLDIDLRSWVSYTLNKYP